MHDDKYHVGLACEHIVSEVNACNGGIWHWRIMWMSFYWEDY
jgi:hypothetical protein